MTQLLHQLRELGVLSFKLSRPGFKPRNPESNLVCDYHLGLVGHSTEDCQKLKRKVQDLIDTGIIKVNGSHIHVDIDLLKIRKEPINKDNSSTGSRPTGTRNKKFTQLPMSPSRVFHELKDVNLLPPIPPFPHYRP